MAGDAKQPVQTKKPGRKIAKPVYNKSTRQHLVTIDGIERWLTDFQVEIVLRDKKRKVVFPKGSIFLAKPSETKRPCKNC